MLFFDRLSSELVKSNSWTLMALTCFILAAKF
jgi:type IV secretory pathway TrbF-like protein